MFDWLKTFGQKRSEVPTELSDRFRLIGESLFSDGAYIEILGRDGYWRRLPKRASTNQIMELVRDPRLSPYDVLPAMRDALDIPG